MFKCKECGTEYEIKPDYCDCGNNEFEVIETKSQETKIEKPDNTEQKNEPVKEQKNYNDTVNKFESFSAEPSARSVMHPQRIQKKSFEERYPEINRFIHMADPLSLGFLVICIILSVLIILFAWEYDNSAQNIQEKNPKKNINNEIPSIDKLWNNSPPKIEQKNAKTTVQTVTPIKDNQPKVNVTSTIQTKSNSQKNVSKSVTKTTTKTANAKSTTNKPANTKKQTDVKQNNINKSTNTNNIEAKKKAEETAKKKAEETAKKKAEEEAAKKIAAENAKKTAEQKAKQDAAAKQELANYKIKLRNTIGRKIDFTQVSGNGSCSVVFRIDSSGKIINRSFSHLSTNTALNDAVYAAVMATPSFNPPPQIYKNELLNLYIKFQDGNFEISLY